MIAIFFLGVIIISWGYLTSFPIMLFIGMKSSSLPFWITTLPIAHRGLHALHIPENSLLAFEKAKERGFGIELDVRLTKDNQVVVFHDEALDRLTGVIGKTNAFTYEELSKFSLQGTDQKIPLLREVLQLVNGVIPIYIEIKNTDFFSNNYILEKNIYEEIRNYNGSLTVISFNPFSLSWFKKYAPHILRGQTSASYKDAKNLKDFFWKRLFLKQYLANFLSQPHFLIYNLQDIPHNATLQLLRKKIPLITYGVNNLETLKLAHSMKINFMFDYIEDQITINT